MGCVDNVLEEHTVPEPTRWISLIMTHCKNNINLYHNENIKSQKVTIMEKRIGQVITEQWATIRKEKELQHRHAIGTNRLM